MSIQSSRSSIVFCGVILGLTAFGKIYALVLGSGLLEQTHPFLPGTFRNYMWLGLLVELVAFAMLVLSGAQAFLSACLALAGLFIAYHAVEAGLHIHGPCPCLGGFLGRWKPLAQSEALVSFLD